MWHISSYLFRLAEQEVMEMWVVLHRLQQKKKSSVCTDPTEDRMCRTPRVYRADMSGLWSWCLYKTPGVSGKKFGSDSKHGLCISDERLFLTPPDTIYKFIPQYFTIWQKVHNQWKPCTRSTAAQISQVEEKKQTQQHVIHDSENTHTNTEQEERFKGARGASISSQLTCFRMTSVLHCSPCSQYVEINMRSLYETSSVSKTMSLQFICVNVPVHLY